MIKLSRVISENPYILICEFNNNEVILLNVLPLIEQHKHLKGVSKLLDKETFAKVEVGELGEITWRNIVISEHNGISTCWDYDISPEFAFTNSILRSE